MMFSFIMRSRRAALAAACAGVLFASVVSAQQRGGAPEGGVPEEDVLRVCADPNNLPQSNRNGEGYENKIAEALARDLGRRLEYTFFPQRMGFVRNTLRSKDEEAGRYRCDVIIGVPNGYELTMTTRPYMRSTYALLLPKRAEFAGITRPDQLLQLPPERLRTLRVGIFARSPGADWLLRNGLLDRAVFYAQQSGDPDVNPTGVIEQDMAEGRIDAAVVWGPIAGFLVANHRGAEEWVAMPFTPDPQLKFDYEISMGVRFGESAWRDTLDAWIASHRDEIDAILVSYGVPLLDDDGRLKVASRTR